MTEHEKCDLVLEGGGVKGIALVGALSVLEEAGYRFERVAGTSAGAIVGSLVAAGIPAADLVDILKGLDYRRYRLVVREVVTGVDDQIRLQPVQFAQPLLLELLARCHVQVADM